MKALIIYRDFITAARANSILLNSATNPALDVLWNIRPWRMDMLKFPPTSSEALSDAQDAHIIIFTGDCAQTFSFWFQDWLEHWAKTRQIEDPVLAAICTTPSGQNPESAASTSDLNKFALRHGFRIIFDERSVTAAHSSQPTALFQGLMPNLALNLNSGTDAPGPRSSNSPRPEGA